MDGVVTPSQLNSYVVTVFYSGYRQENMIMLVRKQEREKIII